MNQITAIAARIERRREMYDTSIVRELPAPNTPRTIPTIAGHYAQTETRGKFGTRRRLIVRYDSVRVGDLIETPTAAARDYLAANGYHAKRPRGALAYESVKRIINRFSMTPSYAQPGRFDDGEYIDLRAAYFQIMSLVGWDVSYAPGRYLGAGRSVSDFPFPNNRIARNSMLSSAQIAQFCVLQPPNGAPKMSRRMTELTNLQLIAAVSDLLHSVAARAVDCGAVYVNTDGYIAPDHATAQRIKSMLSDFGLASRVKFSGAGMVHSVGCYEIGELKTRNVGRGTVSGTRSNIADVEYWRWVQKNMEYLRSKNET